MLTARDSKLHHPNRTATWEVVPPGRPTIWTSLTALNKDVTAVLHTETNPPSAVVALRDARIVKVKMVIKSEG